MRMRSMRYDANTAPVAPTMNVMKIDPPYAASGPKRLDACEYPICANGTPSIPTERTHSAIAKAAAPANAPRSPGARANAIDAAAPAQANANASPIAGPSTVTNP